LRAKVLYLCEQGIGGPDAAALGEHELGDRRGVGLVRPYFGNLE
jgi:hypothetical protein